MNSLLQMDGVVTGSKTWSFYLSSSRALIDFCSKYGDAVTIRGPDGPATIREMRDRGFCKPALFDGEGWRGRPLESEAWIGAQRAAGSPWPFTSGSFIPWDRHDRLAPLVLVNAEIETATRLEAVPLVAVDVRLVANEPRALSDALSNADYRVGFILVHPQDPLAVSGAVAGLRLLAENVPGLMLLRSDHGAIGALAFGASHASMGLRPTHRHGTLPERPGSGKPYDRTARIFSYQFADWFTASIIAGWALADPALMKCHLDCCDGKDLSRFLDDDLRAEAMHHNIVALAQLTEEILSVPDVDHRRTFLEFCNAAAARYDLGGRGPTNPKPQLTGWVLS